MSIALWGVLVVLLVLGALHIRKTFRPGASTARRVATVIAGTYLLAVAVSIPAFLPVFGLWRIPYTLTAPTSVLIDRTLSSMGVAETVSAIGVIPGGIIQTAVLYAVIYFGARALSADKRAQPQVGTHSPATTGAIVPNAVSEISTEKVAPMSKHEVATLACRVLAVYFFASAVLAFATALGTSAAMYYPAAQGPGANPGGFALVVMTLASYWSPAIAQFLVGLFLWWLAPGIARRMFPKKSDAA